MDYAPEVESRHLDEPIRQVDLEHEARELWDQIDEVNAGHTARTLLKQGKLRVVLIAIKKGASIPEHKADGEVAIHLLTGRAVVDVSGERRELRPGHVMGLATALRHDIEALEDTCLLMTVSMLR